MAIGIGEMGGYAGQAYAPAGKLHAEVTARKRGAEAPEIQVGFGKDSLSPNAAVLKTIRRTFAQARNLVPSLQELREANREARVQQEAAAGKGAADSAQGFSPKAPEANRADASTADSPAGVVRREDTAAETVGRPDTGTQFEAFSFPETPHGMTLPGNPAMVNGLNLLA